jgi:hypothetical protein
VGWVPLCGLVYSEKKIGYAAAKASLKCPFGSMVRNVSGGRDPSPKWECTCEGKPKVRLLSRGDGSWSMQYIPSHPHCQNGNANFGNLPSDSLELSSPLLARDSTQDQPPTGALEF